MLQNETEHSALESDADASSSSAFKTILGGFRTWFDDELREWLARKRAAFGADAPDVVGLVDTLQDLVLNGGKRLRPALVYYGFRACGGEGTDHEILSLAMTTELLHAYLLIHDDIMDHADVRRGQPTAHVRFRNLHRANEWPGDAEHYGKSVAILIGNMAHAYAQELFTTASLASPRRRVLQETFSTMEAEVIAGQQLEMQLAHRQQADAVTLRRVLQLKSGRYSVQHPLQLGAIQAEGTEGQRVALSRYGAAAGAAFQLQDDLLGMFGDPDTVGKPVGDDLREGKFTFLIYHTLKLASPEQRRVVRDALGTPDLPPSAVDRVCDIIRQCGAVDRVRTMIDERLRVARDALADSTFEPEAETFLRGLTNYLGGRNQ